ncbi:hypothetical protein [Kutzneria buriramensis]|uniref:DUF5666 domain-containing protein n=1 Tax=Kutzneria buriramensis TaxID=1045776 RepID=A0A3E0GXD1_9PSEU|nr:hypothetical protein [Kutzneria buriramensis]REH33050.1 hypothetical protein BCF44_120122 [Kutzneria buriramensis]
MNALHRIATAVVATAAAGALLGGTAAASAAPVAPAASASAEVSVSGSLSAVVGNVITVTTSANAHVKITLTSGTTIEGSLSLDALITVKGHQVGGSLVADAVIVG